MAHHNSSEYIRLKELGNSKFEVAKNESDIRGWTVKNGQGRILGKVNDLLFDVESEKVLYMVLDLEGNEIHLKERKVMAPLDIADINEAHRNIVYPGVLANELTELPTYEKGKVSTRIEDLVHHAFSTVNREQTTSSVENPSSISTNRQDVNTITNVNTQYNTERSNQVVVGVFEHLNQGQIAVEYLLGHNFSKDQIELSGRTYDEGRTDDGSVTNWFKSLFGNDEDAKTYSEAARTGCVVTVQTSSVQEAEKAADILDLHGAVSVNDSYANQQRNHRSRIVNRNNAEYL